MSTFIRPNFNFKDSSSNPVSTNVIFDGTPIGGGPFTSWNPGGCIGSNSIFRYQFVPVSGSFIPYDNSYLFPYRCWQDTTGGVGCTASNTENINIVFAANTTVPEIHPAFYIVTYPCSNKISLIDVSSSPYTSIYYTINGSRFSGKNIDFEPSFVQGPLVITQTIVYSYIDSFGVPQTITQTSGSQTVTVYSIIPGVSFTLDCGLSQQNNAFPGNNNFNQCCDGVTAQFGAESIAPVAIGLIIQAYRLAAGSPITLNIPFKFLFNCCTSETIDINLYNPSTCIASLLSGAITYTQYLACIAGKPRSKSLDGVSINSWDLEAGTINITQPTSPLPTYTPVMEITGCGGQVISFPMPLLFAP